MGPIECIDFSPSRQCGQKMSFREKCGQSQSDLEPTPLIVPELQHSLLK